MSDADSTRHPFVWVIVGFVLIGTPIVAYIWHVLNDGLAGHITLVRFAGAALALALFTLLARLLRRTLLRLEPHE
jgi:hypothetical protein